MEKKYTASEVRDQARFLDGLSRQMLNRFADRLEADEKAEPIYQWQHRPMHHPEYWKDCRNKEEWDHKRNSLPEAGFRIVYTNPSSADAERLAEALRQAMQSLRTIECGAMREEGLEDAGNVRAYARSRADVAGNALAAQDAWAKRKLPGVALNELLGCNTRREP